MADRNGFFSRNLGILVATACLMVLAMLAFSNIYFLNNTGSLADEVRRNQEIALVQREIDHQVAILAMDQSQISNWSDVAKTLNEPDIDVDFLKEEIAEWMWADFGIQMSVIVGADNKSRAAVFEEDVLAPAMGDRAVERNKDLIEKARLQYHAYLANQTLPVKVFTGDHHPVRSNHPFYVWSIRPFNNGYAFVMAMAIVPDEEIGVSVGEPNIYLTFKPLLEEDIEEISTKLELAEFRITSHPAGPDAAVDDLAGMLSLTQLPDGEVVAAKWAPSMPSRTIWQKTVPVLVCAFLIAVLLLGAVAWRFSSVVKALQKSEEQNRFLALHDALTGLPNRLQFDHELEAIIADGKQDRCAILCMDLDRFKAVNDTFGHQAGDVVLKTISERISDHVGDKGLAARIGGDEFIILLHDQLDRDSVLFLCDQLIEEVCIPIDIPGGTAEVGASIGVAWWPDDAMTVKSIIRTADEALYWSKENGRGQVSCASKLRRSTDRPNASGNQDRLNHMRDELAAVG